jgi:LacI family transcriptional regulator
MALKTNTSPDKSKSGIRAIAEALGISIATVDRALHNRGRISEETRTRVLRMAERLEYQPNLAARNLKLNRHFTVSVNLPIGRSFFDRLRAGVLEGASPFRSTLKIEFRNYTRTQDHNRELESIKSAIDAQVHGIITAPPNTPQMAALVSSAKEKAIPIIYISTDAPESGRLSAVTAYPFNCGAMAAEVLASFMQQQGSIAVLAGDLENLNQSEKVRGFRTALSQTSPELAVASVIEARDEPNEVYQQTRRLLQTVQNLSALYIATSTSVPALAALQDAGRLGSVFVVTTDLFPGLVRFIRDGAVKATVFQCPEKQGSIAIQTMFRYLSEGIVPSPSIGVIPQLIIRSNLDLYSKNLEDVALPNSRL